MDKLKAFDAYARPAEEFRVRTVSGALISLVCSVVITVLVLGELRYYLAVQVRPEITLDQSLGERLNISFDVTFPHVGCAFLGVDTMDISGNHQLDITHGVYKQRLSRTGEVLADPRRGGVDERPSENERQAKAERDRALAAGLEEPTEDEKRAEEDSAAAAAAAAAERCGDCYGAQSETVRCCNTCEEVRRAYSAKGWLLNPDNVPQCVAEMNTKEMKRQAKGHEGCRVYGFVTVNKVAGNFHIAPGESSQGGFQHIHSTSMVPDDVNVTHTIHSLAFGAAFPGQVNALDGHTEVDRTGAMRTQYFVNVVPTTYTYRSGRTLASNQFSATINSQKVDMAEARQRGAGTPGLYVSYDMSPIAITYREYQRTFAHFLTGICAIVGGVFTITSLFDKAVYRGMHSLKEKVDLGKTF